MPAQRWKPAVSKYWLITLAGIIWSAVGLMLCRLAYLWLSEVSRSLATELGLLGIVLSLAAYWFGFSKIAGRNIERLCLLEDKSCIFAFQAWKSYLIIIFMVALGILLRSSPLPKHYLAVIYTIIGGALFLSSLQFYRCVWNLKIRKQSCRRTDESL